MDGWFLLVQQLIEFKEEGVEFRRIVLGRDLSCQFYQAFSMFPLHGWASECQRLRFSTNHKWQQEFCCRTDRRLVRQALGCG